MTGERRVVRTVVARLDDPKHHPGCDDCYDAARLLEALEARLVWRDANESSLKHYEGCWRDHYTCCIEHVRVLEETLALTRALNGRRE